MTEAELAAGLTSRGWLDVGVHTLAEWRRLGHYAAKDPRRRYVYARKGNAYAWITITTAFLTEPTCVDFCSYRLAEIHRRVPIRTRWIEGETGA